MLSTRFIARLFFCLVLLLSVKTSISGFVKNGIGLSNAQKIASINLSFERMAQQLAQAHTKEPVNHAKMLKSSLFSLEMELFMIMMDFEEIIVDFDPS